MHQVWRDDHRSASGADAATQAYHQEEVSVPERVKRLMKENGLSGVNKPKRTPSHATKSHVVMAKEGDEYRLVRFGQQGVRGAGSNPTSAKDKARRKAYYARHNAQDASPSKLSARYWSHREKW